MIVVIVNEKAGDGPEGGARREALRAGLREAGLDAQVRGTGAGDSLEALARQAIEDGATTLVAAGGDGTIAALAGPCHAAGLRLGVIPQGTFNYFARAHGIPEDTTRAISILAEAPVRDVVLGTVNGRVFLNNTSLGLYPTILKTREEVYAKYGRSRAAAYWSVLQTLAGQPPAMRLGLRLDGRRVSVRTPLAFVAKSAYQLEEFDIEGIEALNDGAFALLIAPHPSRFHLLRAAWRMARGKARKGPDFRLYSASEIVIETRARKVLVACDGEKMEMRTPLEIRAEDRPLHLIAPRKDAA